MPPSQIQNVWNGLDTELYQPDPSVQRDPKELLCVARASDPKKGVMSLVDTLARLPNDVHLTLVDADTPLNPARTRARTLGCADRIHFTGHISNEELVRLYCRAAVVVVPSLYEGFGLPAAEAMACGTPVASSSAGALREVMEIGTGGLMFTAGDRDEMEQVLRTLLDDEALRNKLGAQSRARIEAHFSWPQVAQSTLRVYQEVLGQPS